MTKLLPAQYAVLGLAIFALLLFVVFISLGLIAISRHRRATRPIPQELQFEIPTHGGAISTELPEEEEGFSFNGAEKISGRAGKKKKKKWF